MPRKKTTIAGDLLNIVGRRGEIIVEELLTNYRHFKRPLFAVAHLGDKWPTSDFYAKLFPVKGLKPVALFQVKTSAAKLRNNAANFHCQLSKEDAVRLGRLPVPCYLLGVSEGSRRVFVRVVDKKRKRGMSVISIANELSIPRLADLHAEIADWWLNNGKTQSNFL